jgi:hypothetical protein
MTIKISRYVRNMHNPPGFIRRPVVRSCRVNDAKNRDCCCCWLLLLLLLPSLSHTAGLKVVTPRRQKTTTASDIDYLCSTDRPSHPLDHHGQHPRHVIALQPSIDQHARIY